MSESQWSSKNAFRVNGSRTSCVRCVRRLIPFLRTLKKPDGNLIIRALVISIIVFVFFKHPTASRVWQSSRSRGRVFVGLRRLGRERFSRDRKNAGVLSKASSTRRVLDLGVGGGAGGRSTPTGFRIFWRTPSCFFEK